MKVELIHIGNSRGIRIPKPLIEQCGFQRTVELRVDGNRLVIAPDRPPRHDWDKTFRAAGPSTNDEVLLGSMPPNAFDREDWNW